METETRGLLCQINRVANQELTNPISPIDNGRCLDNYVLFGHCTLFRDCVIHFQISGKNAENMAKVKCLKVLYQANLDAS